MKVPASRIRAGLVRICLILFVGRGVTTVGGNGSSNVGAPNTLPSSASVDLEAINGTLNFRIYGKKGKDDKPWFEGRGLDMRHIQCVRRARCVRLTNLTCLDAKIPYEYTSLDLTDYPEQKHVWERLQMYRALQNVPKCWAVIQPFLCSVFAPKCEQINGEDMVFLPSLEMCRITMEPCRFLYNTSFFPEFMRCNETLFPPKCNNVVREMKFNVSGHCPRPLVPADSAASYYPGIEGCGVQCKDPLYTDDEHRQIHKLTAWGGSLCLLANLFVIATFFIDWENASKYPALIVFYINLCFMIACIGWLVQFTPGSREDIVCRKDGTLRHSEPSAGENLSCVVVFVLVYYFLMAAMVWFVFLTYAWHLRAVGNVQDRIDKKGSYFHLVAWSLPLVLTITTMALSEVDGNSIAGICFVGYMNHAIRAGLLMGPLCGVILVGGYFIVRGMVMLFGLKHFANDIKSASASNKIHLIIVRMGLCAVFTLIFILVAIACNVSEFRHTQQWAESLREYIVCQVLSTTDEHLKCKLTSRPSVAILQLHLLCLFGAGIVMSTWCWTPSSLDTWRRHIRHKCGKEVVEEIRMPKHKVIAQTWAKRKEFEDKGRLSITLCNTHTDPVGLNFDVNDLNSSETNEISSTWANYLPQFVKRRMALTGAATTNSSSQGPGPRKNSLDSEISFSVRHVSVESRRNSVDSQVSVKIAEMKTKVASRSRGAHHHHHHQTKHAAASQKRSQKRRDFMAAAAATSGRKYGAAGGGRRESSTSIESQVIAMKKTTYPNASSHKVDLFAHSSKHKHSSAGGGAPTGAKHMKRRSACAGLDADDISEFLTKNSHFIVPFLQRQGLASSSDDEEVDEHEENPRSPHKAYDARLDFLLKQDLSGSDDEDEEEEEPNQLVLYDGMRAGGKHGRKKSPKIEEVPDLLALDRNAKKQAVLECLLKTMKNSQDSNANRHSRNSQRSRQSRKSQTNANNHAAAGSNHNQKEGNSLRRHSKRKVKRQKPAAPPSQAKSSKNKDAAAMDLRSDNLSAASFYSTNDDDEDELNIPLGVMLHSSSYSGRSTGKANSRSSKTSCDVGIQANAYEIATHAYAGSAATKAAARKSDLINGNVAHLLNGGHTAFNGDDDADDATEMHALLHHGANSNHHQHNAHHAHHHQHGGQKKAEASALSESEKLKLLLLPSK